MATSTIPDTCRYRTYEPRVCSFKASSSSMRLYSSKVSLPPFLSLSLCIKATPTAISPTTTASRGTMRDGGPQHTPRGPKKTQQEPENHQQNHHDQTFLLPPPSPPPSSSSPLPSLSLPAVSFLDRCFLCNKSLSPGKDIYMYRGDRAFCSVECRCRQIFMDEESVVKENCSTSAVASRRRSKAAAAAKNRAGGLFAY